MAAPVDRTDLEDLARDCLIRAGVPPGDAQVAARDYTAAEFAGFGDSGLRALLRDLRLIRYGRLRVDAVPMVIVAAPAALHVDGRHGFAAIAADRARADLVTAARINGVASLHLFAISPPGSMIGPMLDLAAADMAAIAMCRHRPALAVRPGSESVTTFVPPAQTCMARLVSGPALSDDTPLDGPVIQAAWITCFDPDVTAAEALLCTLPPASDQAAETVPDIPPDLLAEIINA